MSYRFVENAGMSCDFEELHRLLHRCFAGMEGRIDPPSSLHRMSPEYLRKMAQEQVLITCYDGEHLIGCGFAEDQGEVFYLSKLAIDPAHRGRGLLREMVNRFLRLALESGKSALELETRIELVENHAVFAALGFELLRETRHEGYDRTTGLRFRKSL